MQDRIDLMNLIHNEFNPTVTRVFLTGRHHIKPEVDGSFQQGTTEIEITADAGDIRAYLHHKIAEDSHIDSDSMNEYLQKEIVSTITKCSKGMFLLPVVHINMVLEETTIRACHKRMGYHTGLELE